jgi:hypothetical protein
MLKKRRRSKTQGPPVTGTRPPAIPDVDVATPEPDLWGGEGGGGAYPGGPTGRPRKRNDRDRGRKIG